MARPSPFQRRWGDLRAAALHLSADSEVVGLSVHARSGRSRRLLLRGVGLAVDLLELQLDTLGLFVQWLRIEENNELLVGIRLFSGIARAVAVRPDNFNAPSAIKDFERALWLPEMATPTTPATLILPSGWYQAGRCVELHGDRKQVVTLVNLLEKGSDFERCTFTFDQNL